MGTKIQINDLTKTFGTGKNAVNAVDNLSLTINPGELFFLLGPSGCGKTTLLRMIAGFIDPTAGSIAFDDKIVTHDPPNKRNTGMVFQSYALWPHMTVAQNVAFGLNVRKVQKPDRDKQVIQALEAVQMAQYAHRKPTELSGGQQQRVALARAIVIKPAVLLLDEPLSNLDAKLRNDLRHQIRDVCKSSGITTVYVTHDQKEALSMADKVALLKDGKIMQLGTPVGLYRKPKSKFVAEFLGETNLIHTKASGSANNTTLQIEAGTFNASLDQDHSGDTLISIRPEAITLKQPGTPNTLPGKLLHSTYLGETAQHIIQLKGAPPIKVAQLNPFAPTTIAPNPGDQVALHLSPTDIVPITHS
ncbi:MAG: ABC transporter ATP-binding protein [Phycisphaerales bacterium]|nr:ABC transporter ATP-binding protein [Phycisphaerales bacterium]